MHCLQLFGVVFVAMYSVTSPVIAVSRHVVVFVAGALAAEVFLFVVIARWAPVLAFWCLIAHILMPLDAHIVENPFSQTQSLVLCLIVSALFTRRILI